MKFFEVFCALCYEHICWNSYGGPKGYHYCDACKPKVLSGAALPQDIETIDRLGKALSPTSKDHDL